MRELKEVLINSCPLNELKEVESAIVEGTKNGSIPLNILKNYWEILTLLKDELHNITNPDPVSLGSFLGKFYKIAVLGGPKALKFLVDYSVSLKINPVDYVVGFIEGSSSVPVEQNQCIAGTRSFIDELAASLQGIYDAIASRQGIKEAFTRFMQTATKLKDVEPSCHFISLAMSFISITNPITIAKITARVVKNLGTVIDLLKGAVKAQLAGDLRTTGVNIGKLMTIILKYTTQ